MSVIAGSCGFRVVKSHIDNTLQERVAFERRFNYANLLATMRMSNKRHKLTGTPYTRFTLHSSHFPGAATRTDDASGQASGLRIHSWRKPSKGPAIPKLKVMAGRLTACRESISEGGPGGRKQMHLLSSPDQRKQRLPSDRQPTKPEGKQGNSSS